MRGLHYQVQHAQGKLMQVTQGAVFDVAVQIRDGSPTFELSTLWSGHAIGIDWSLHLLGAPPLLAANEEKACNLKEVWDGK